MEKNFHIVLALLAFLAAAPSLQAAEITVNSSAWEPYSLPYAERNNGNCTIGEAIRAAEVNSAIDRCPAGSASAPDIIHLQENTLYTITSEWAPGTKTAMMQMRSGAVVIEGHGSTLQRPADAPPFRFFFFAQNASMTIRHLTLSGGSLTGANDFGGAIHHFGSLIVEDSTLRGNSAGNGGAIYSQNTFNTTTSALSSLTMDRCTVADNRASVSGGAFFLEGHGIINDTTFTNNATTLVSQGRGGAIFHKNGNPRFSNRRYPSRPFQEGLLRINRSLFSNNAANFGAAIYNDGTQRRRASDPMDRPGKLSMLNDTVSNNNSLAHRGALYNRGHAYIFNSSFLGNVGGAIRSEGINLDRSIRQGAYLLVANSTVANNTKNRNGAGIEISSIDSGRLVHSTVTGNVTSDDTADGIYVASTSFRIQNSIIAGNGNGDCGNAPDRPRIVSLGNNIFGNTSNCYLTLGPQDQVNVDPRLGPLTVFEEFVYGNEYFPLLEGSPAINAGNPAACVNAGETPHLDRDQINRGREGICDIGSSEAISMFVHWPFDAPTPTLFMHDESGNGIHGELHGVDRERDFPPGVFGNALQCDGVDNFVRTQEAVPVGIGARWTLSWWQNLESVDAIQNIFTLGAPSENPDQNPLSYLDFIVTPGGYVSMNYTGQDGAANGLSLAEPALAAGVWQHIVLTNSGGDTLAAIQLYVNGMNRPLNGAPQISAQDNHPRFVNLCRELNRDRRYVAGKIDNFIVLNRPFSLEEVLAECRTGEAAAGITCGP